MAANTVNLVVKVPEALRRQARAAAVMRGETISEVVRQALAEYIVRAEEEEDTVFARQVLDSIEGGAPTYAHADVWAELDPLEAAG